MSITSMNQYSPVRSIINNRMNHILKDSIHKQGNKEEDRGEVNTRIEKLQLEADICLEGGDFKEYISILDSIYDMIKSKGGYNKLLYEIGIQFQKYGFLEKALIILLSLYEIITNSDQNTQVPSKPSDTLSFKVTLAIDIGNTYFSSSDFKSAFSYFTVALKSLQGSSENDLS
mmetsp:Transcript_15577/g.13617  ORF Transcript_15577/g.13617 Transcript_15577/m.13617 type:complete len:173 (+) Transcript_15577:13-531(+)